MLMQLQTSTFVLIIKMTSNTLMPNCLPPLNTASLHICVVYVCYPSAPVCKIFLSIFLPPPSLYNKPALSPVK